MRVVALKTAGVERFVLEKKNFLNNWTPFKVMGLKPFFNSEEEAKDFIKQWEEGDSQKIVSEFTINN